MKNKKIASSYHSDNSGLTFFEVFQNAIISYEQENPKQTVKGEYDQYTLYEDLKLLIELSKIPQVETKHFERIAEFIGRNKTNLRRRYSEYLKYITQDDFQMIYNFIQQNGIYGYCIFHVENGIWRLQEVAPIKKTQQIQQQISTPIKQEQKNSIQQSIQQSKQQQQQQQQLQQQQSISKQINSIASQSIQKSQQEFMKIEPQQQKKIKLNKFQLSASQKYDQSDKKGQNLKIEKGKINLNLSDKRDLEELNISLKLLSDITKVSLKDLAQSLYQCSGDINILLDVYLNHQEHHLWTKEADEALRAYDEETNQFEKQKLEALLNGEEKIKRRRDWLIGK